MSNDEKDTFSRHCLVIGNNSTAKGICSIAIGDNIMAVNGSIATTIDPPSISLSHDMAVKLLIHMTLGPGMVDLFKILDNHHGPYKMKIVRYHVKSYMDRIYQRCVQNKISVPKQVQDAIQNRQYKM